MSRDLVLTIRYDDRRLRTARKATLADARATVERQEATGERVDLALVTRDGYVVARYDRAEGWKGATR